MYSIKLKCNLENAPLQIKKFYKNLITNIEIQDTEKYLRTQKQLTKDIYKFKLDLHLSKLTNEGRKVFMEMTIVDGN